MAVVPTRHFYPRTNTFIDSFNTSVSKFPLSTRLHFLMYSYHALPFKLSFCAANSSTTNSAVTFQQNPQKGLNHHRETKCKAMGLAGESAISNGQASGLSFSRNSASIHQRNSPKRSNFYGGASEADVSKGQVRSLNSSRNSWLDKWSETQKNKLKGPQSVVDYRNGGEGSGSDSDHQECSSSTGITMERIVQKLKIFQNVENSGGEEDNADKVFEKGSIEDVLRIDEGILPDSRGGFSEERPFGDDSTYSSNGEMRFPWEKPEVNAEEEQYSARKKIRKSLAELTLPEAELNRLKILTFKMKNKLKIGGAGVSQDIVEKIHERWKESEVVRLKIEAAPSLNMKRMHEVLEKKTGGLVIWRSGTSVALYRGLGYKVESEKPQKRTYNKDDIPHLFAIITTDTSGDKLSEKKTVSDELATQVEPETDLNEGTEIKSKAELKYEDEIEILLDGLGPRYTDWPGPDPLPVDADLLPGVLPGYQPPFRILPYGVRSTLSSTEATDLRRLARVIPPHFALGRSRQHQGLAAAMIKLWERSSIAKIALKRGVQLSTSEKMAEEIKKLTGCIMLSRNKDFLVFYRGKNFLSPEVAEALLEKGRLAKTLQDEEEQARLRASAFVAKGVPRSEESGTAGTLGETLDAEEQARLRASAFVAKGVPRSEESGTAGTLGETLDADARWGKKLDNKHKEKIMRDVEILRHANLVKRIENKLATVERKILKAERALSKVEQSLNPARSIPNPDCITEEERFMFRKLGLRMKAFLLLGRRGVFSGTIENMHLHWKYRELVKIIVKSKNFDQVKRIALSLEAESGGVLVSVDKVSKGYALIVFRGKEYTRPSALRPRNLLTKRQALARSIELQRHEALMKHISTLQRRYDQMRYELEEMAKIEDHGDEELYNKIDSTYLTEDEESEEEGEEPYPQVYDEHDDRLDQTRRKMEKAYDKNDDLLDRFEEEEGNNVSLTT